MPERYDAAIVGAGIVGLAHAYHLAAAHRRVVVFDRSPSAQGASIRNFGMIWPIGQPPGELRRLADRSRAIWMEVLSRSGAWHDPCGSLHLAYRPDEAQVLQEFARQAQAAGVEVALLDPGAVLARCPAVRAQGLLAGLESESELLIDPPEAITRLTEWLAAEWAVEFRFGCAATSWDGTRLVAGDRAWAADRLLICSGADLQTLFPGWFAQLGLVPCKLQMLKSRPLDRRLGCLLAGGLTLRHYAAFAECRSLPALRERIARELPDYDRWGIHVMAAQGPAGELVIGDSHEYGDRITPFDRAEIDARILGYLETFLDVKAAALPVAARWHGIYVRHPVLPYVVGSPAPAALAVNGLGGAGMTLSFGLAEQMVREHLL